MRINGLLDLGGVAGLFANMGNASGGDGLSHAGARKEPRVELIELPVAPQQWEQIEESITTRSRWPLPWRTLMTIRVESMSVPCK